MAPRKSTIDYSTPEGIRVWLIACDFRSDRKAALSIEIPFRTFCRWKQRGMPSYSATDKAATLYVLGLMDDVLKARKK